MGLKAFIFVISSLALSYEILLIKILHVTQLSIIVSTVISLALLGYAVSGVFLALTKSKIKNGMQFLAINGVLFSIFIPLSVIISNIIPINPLELFWDLKQLLYLSGMYGILVIPFFFAANCIGFSYTHFQKKIATIYFYDLTGAAFGPIAIVVFSNKFSPSAALFTLGIMSGLSSVLFLLTVKNTKKWFVTIVAACSIAFQIGHLSSNNSIYQLSEYTPLAKTLTVPDRKIIDTYHSPSTSFDVVSEGKIPFRLARGLSTQYRGNVPSQLLLFQNGKAPIPLYKEAPSTDFLEALPNSLPYKIWKIEKILSIGATCLTPHMVSTYNIKKVKTVGVTPTKVSILQDKKWKCSHSRIEYTSNLFTNRGKNNYDLIEMPFESGSGNDPIFSRSYYLTVESIITLLDQLKTNGVISIHQHADFPPRKLLKLLNTAIESLKASKTKRPQDHFALISTLTTQNILIKKSPFTESEWEKIYTYTLKNNFKLTNPSVDKATAPLFTTQRLPYVTHYPYNIKMSTRDKNNSDHFFKWGIFLKAIKLKEIGGLPLISWKIPMTIITLLLALTLGFLFLIVPLILLNKRKSKKTLRPSLYFSSIGSGFIIIEIALIHYISPYLGNLIYSIGVCLGGILLFSGLGGLYTKKISAHQTKALFYALLLVLMTYYFTLPDILIFTSNLPTLAKTAISIIIIALIAAPMGMLFPTGMLYLSNSSPNFIPWAWGLNGLSMVIGAIITPIIILEAGLQNTILIGAMFYLGAGVSYYGLKTKISSTA